MKKAFAGVLLIIVIICLVRLSSARYDWQTGAELLGGLAYIADSEQRYFNKNKAYTNALEELDVFIEGVISAGDGCFDALFAPPGARYYVTKNAVYCIAGGKNSAVITAAAHTGNKPDGRFFLYTKLPERKDVCVARKYAGKDFCKALQNEKLRDVKSEQCHLGLECFIM